MMRRLVLTETASGLTYTAQTSVPVGARITDILVETFAVWTAATITVDVGDSDSPQALVAAIDISNQNFVNGKIGFNATAWGDSNGNGAPYSDAGTGKLYPNGDLITVVGTATVPGGPTGLTYVTLLMEPAGVLRQAAVA